MPVEKTAIYFNTNPQKELLLNILNSVRISYIEKDQVFVLQIPATGSKNPPDSGSPGTLPPEKRIIKGNVSNTNPHAPRGEYNKVEYALSTTPTLIYTVDSGTLEDTSEGVFELRIKIA